MPQIYKWCFKTLFIQNIFYLIKHKCFLKFSLMSKQGDTFLPTNLLHFKTKKNLPKYKIQIIVECSQLIQVKQQKKNVINQYNKFDIQFFQLKNLVYIFSLYFFLSTQIADQKTLNVSLLRTINYSYLNKQLTNQWCFLNTSLVVWEIGVISRLNTLPKHNQKSLIFLFYAKKKQKSNNFQAFCVYDLMKERNLRLRIKQNSILNLHQIFVTTKYPSFNLENNSIQKRYNRYQLIIQLKN
eukprot:TRINITY_DN14491_c0_g2_i4.p1 TRINITY_DN14491_c0_g2~~TRINITY_DN14491_c0_g2_i4.p1  ORF type:complete len:240 (-),score=-9.59 TRINITY_DN14491_c0_g2_i4:797-1516(-)